MTTEAMLPPAEHRGWSCHLEEEEVGLSLCHSPSPGRGLWVLGCWGDPARPDCLARCRDGLPYCEADYHAEFGIRCDGCGKYITGHVLEVRPPGAPLPA